MKPFQMPEIVFADRRTGLDFNAKQCTVFPLYQELRRQASWYDSPIMFHHFRDKDGVEVDIVMELSGKVAGIEVKAAATVTGRDFRGLRKLRETTGERFAAGVVVYDGESVAGFGDNLYAIPIRALWEMN